MDKKIERGLRYTAYLAAFILLLLFFEYLKGFIADITSVPYWLDLVTLPAGLLLGLVSIILFETWLVSFSRIKSFFLRYEYFVYLAGILFFLLINILLQITSPTMGDLRYPAKIGFMISQGLMPYFDFFEHHNPLYGYLTAPIFLLFDGLVPVYILHLLSFIMLILSCFVLYLIGLEIFNDKRYSYLIVLFFLSFKNVIITYNIRQDAPAAVCLIIGIYYLLKAGKYSHFVYSGFFLSISFLFVQKTVLQAVGVAGILFILVLLNKNKINVKIKTLISFLSGAGCPLVAFYGLLYLKTGLPGLKVYYAVNFLYNSIIGWGFDNFLNRWMASLISNGAGFMLILIGIFVFIKYYKSLEKFRIILMLLVLNILVWFLFILKYGRASAQDFVYFIPVLSISGVVALVWFCRIINKCPRKAPYLYFILLALLFVVPAVLTGLNAAIPRDDHQIQFYLANFNGEKTNCNFIYNPLYQYHWSINMGNALEAEKINDLFNKYGIDTPDFSLANMINEDFKIICIDATIASSSAAQELANHGYAPYVYNNIIDDSIFIKNKLVINSS